MEVEGLWERPAPPGRGITRRDFCWLAVASLASVAVGCRSQPLDRMIQAVDLETAEPSPAREASFYRRREDAGVQCQLCFQRCIIQEGSRGRCRVRENAGGALYSLVFGAPSAVQVDPVEKLPLHHFRPGSMRLGVGTAGCNFRCRYCQNWQLSQAGVEGVSRIYDLPPDETVQKALELGTGAISFTYNEPTVFFEYMHETARRAQEAGLEVLLNSNGAMNPEPLDRLLEHVTAVNVDLKGFTEEFYQEVASARLEPVLRTLQAIGDRGRWLEIVNLVVPGLNDDFEVIGKMSRWIARRLGRDTPVHFSRFFPAYRLTDFGPTPVKTLETAHGIATGEGLRFVYLGNVPGHPLGSTYCPVCGRQVVERDGWTIGEIGLEKGRCKGCQARVPGLW